METSEAILAGSVGDLVALADDLLKQRQKKAEAEALLKDADGAITAIELKMSELMVALDMPNFAHAGQTFYQRIDNYPSIVDQERFFAWLREHGEDGIIKETVHPQTLRSFYKEKSDEYMSAWLDAQPDGGRPMLTVFQKIKIGVRGKKGKE